MDDSAFGVRDKQGDWKLNQPLEYPPVFVWPPQPIGSLKWLFGFGGYILPWNLFFAAVATVCWLYFTPAMATMRVFAPGWIAYLLVRNLIIDNVIWTLCSGVPIWTAYEAVTLWAFANGYIAFVSMAAHPVYFVVVMLLIPLFRELHFYLIHRMIHWPPLYRAVHRLHHNNVNPRPWSGLSMHPVEHLFYFSGVLIHWINGSKRN